MLTGGWKKQFRQNVADPDAKIYAIEQVKRPVSCGVAVDYHLPFPLREHGDVDALDKRMEVDQEKIGVFQYNGEQVYAEALRPFDYQLKELRTIRRMLKRSPFLSPESLFVEKLATQASRPKDAVDMYALLAYLDMDLGRIAKICKDMPLFYASIDAFINRINSENLIAEDFNSASYHDFYSEIINPRTGRVFEAPHSLLEKVKNSAEEIRGKVHALRYSHGCFPG